MFCVFCGTKLPDGAKYCFSCGAPANRPKTAKHSVNTVQLKCKSCNGVMDVDEDRPILMCPFCGSKEIILEGDKVTIQRIKSKAYRDVELGKQQTFKEVELGKKELEIKGNNSRFIKILLSFLIILIGAVLVYWSFCNVNPTGLLVGIIIIFAGKHCVKVFGGDKNEEELGHATPEDIVMAQIRAEEKMDKAALIIAAIILGSLILIPLIWINK